MSGEIFTVGVNTKLELISETHGAIRVPLAQNFDFTPGFDGRKIFEFDRSDAVAVVSNFNGVDISFSHFDSASKLVDAMVNDLDPGATALVDDPSNYNDITLMLNIKNPDTKLIFQSILVKGCRLNGASSRLPVREEGLIERSGEATNAYRLKGVALEYKRAKRSGSTAFAQGSANSHTDVTAALNGGNYEITLTETVQTVEAKDTDIDGTGLILVLKNGAQYDGASISAGKVLIPSADFTANDVFETFTTYIDA